jgi:hypothetical protein
LRRRSPGLADYFVALFDAGDHLRISGYIAAAVAGSMH